MGAFEYVDKYRVVTAFCSWEWGWFKTGFIGIAFVDFLCLLGSDRCVFCHASDDADAETWSLNSCEVLKHTLCFSLDGRRGQRLACLGCVSRGC
jgi:hypothetical protein